MPLALHKCVKGYMKFQIQQENLAYYKNWIFSNLVDRILSNKNRCKESMKVTFFETSPPIPLSTNVERGIGGEVEKDGNLYLSA